MSPRARASAAAGLVACALVAGCRGADGEGGAMALQVARAYRERVGNDWAGGIGFYGLAGSPWGSSYFADLRYTRSGDAPGRTVEDPPASFGADATTGQQVDAATLHVGGTGCVTDWLHLYAGFGLGYSAETIGSFDPTGQAGDGGFYRVRDEDLEPSVSAGVMLVPMEGTLVGVGYDSYFQGVVLSIGVVW